MQCLMRKAITLNEPTRRTVETAATEGKSQVLEALVPDISREAVDGESWPLRCANDGWKLAVSARAATACSNSLTAQLSS